MVEVWKDIPGSLGYKVSSLGRIKSSRGVMSCCVSGSGYRVVKISGKTRNVHSIVAQVFLGDRPNGFETLHIDGRKNNNSVSNLRYGTKGENVSQKFDDAAKSGTYEETLGKTAKLCMQDIVDIRKLIGKGLSNVEIANRYSVSDALVSLIRSGKRWSRV